MVKDPSFDVAVVGAGVFGVWTAYQLNRAGAEVVLLDAYGPGNSRASSGGESRIIRLGYGADEIYTRMAQRSLGLWHELFDHIKRPKTFSTPAIGDWEPSLPLFQPTGVLWLAKENDPYCEATLETLHKANVRFERLELDQLSRRYPQFELGPINWGIFEPDSGVLMARQALRALAAHTVANGVVYQEEKIVPPHRSDYGKLKSITTLSGREIFANRFVFACGPWLPKLFPELLAELIHVTRQEVFFFGVPANNDGLEPDRLPAWMDFNELVYGIPNLDNRGYKIAIDAHGPEFDPDTGDRLVSTEGLTAVRAYLARRLPMLRDMPVTETRVCQYENTSNGDFLIDRLPSLENVWVVGGGSGHGFKHGPAIGEYVAALISGASKVEARFTLATKEKGQQRMVY